MSKVLDNPVQSILEKKAINMLKDKIDLKFISSVTGFSVDELLILKSKI
jgi:hypothetical protein